MKTLIQNRSWLLLIVLTTCFFAQLGFTPAQAAELKDIRVGEYQRFTRVVFELSEAVLNPVLEIKPSGKLIVKLENTKVALKRKIPVDRSPHVNEIQFWQRGGDLTTLMTFDYPYFRIESFRLSVPPRFAVDVFPLKEPPKEKKAAISAPASGDDNIKPDGQTSASPNKPDKGISLDIAKKEAPMIADSQQAQMPETPQMRPAPLTENTPVTTSSPKRRVSEPPAQRPIAKTPSSIPTTTADIASDPSKRSTPSHAAVLPKTPLQFYLAVILVVMTIAILVLLVWMLLDREKIFGEKLTLNAVKNSLQKHNRISANQDVDLPETPAQ